MTRCFEALATDVRRMIGKDRTMQEAASEAGRTDAREWFLSDEEYRDDLSRARMGVAIRVHAP